MYQLQAEIAVWVYDIILAFYFQAPSSSSLASVWVEFYLLWLKYQLTSQSTKLPKQSLCAFFCNFPWPFAVDFFSWFAFPLSPALDLYFWPFSHGTESRIRQAYESLALYIIWYFLINLELNRMPPPVNSSIQVESFKMWEQVYEDALVVKFKLCYYIYTQEVMLGTSDSHTL